MIKLLIFTILLFASTSFQSALCAPKNMTAKIFYVTNRHWNGKTFNEQRGADSQHSFGTAELLIPTKEVRPDMRYWPTKFTPLGWRYGDAEVKHYLVQHCTREPMTQFFDEVADTMTAAKTNEITVMVHGYCNSFDDSLIGAATMESYLKGVVIDYSWPAVKSSIPNLVQYNIAQNNVTWAQQPFSNYIKSLAERFPGVKINIPFELISNMHKYDRPGGRWQLRTPAVQIVRVGSIN